MSTIRSTRINRRGAVTSAAVPVLLVALIFPATVHAEYLGREPDRIVSLLLEGGPEEIPSAVSEGKRFAREEAWNEAEAAFRRAASESAEGRFGLAVALLQQGRVDEALREIEKLGVVGAVSGNADDREDLQDEMARRSEESYRRYRYAEVLARLRGESELDFPELREEIASVLGQGRPTSASSASFHDAFEVWLALNPSEDELDERLDRLEGRSEPVLRWQRAELRLRLGEPGQALSNDLAQLEPDEPWLRARVRRARARAYYQLSSDGPGQAVYGQMLDDLDEPAAQLLYRDISVLLDADERSRYEGLSLEDKLQFFRTFWTQRHPVPTQRVNPRIGEHYRRLAHVLREYPLQSNGGGYFTDPEVFKEHSPELPYYDPEVLFAHGRASRFWLDHRGLVYLRHGEPDRQMRPGRHGGSEENDSWRLGGYQARPLVFNFVKRDSIGEWVITLNLAVAATGFQVKDDPEILARELALDFRRLYSIRTMRNIHPIYRTVARARDRRTFEQALLQESQIMAAFVKASVVFDSTGYYTQDNTMPMSIQVTNAYDGGEPAFLVHFLVSLADLDASKLGEDASLQTTLILYDEDWTKELRRIEREHPLSKEVVDSLAESNEEDDDENGGPAFIGTLGAAGLEPKAYGVVLEAFQPDTRRVGLARGQHTVNWVPPDGLGMSDLLLLGARKDSGQRGTTGAGSGDMSAGAQWTPKPTRVVHKSKEEAKFNFEVYNPAKDESGRVRYEVEERLLVLQEKPGFWDQMLGIASLAGRMFFPAYTFAAQVGGFTLSQALAEEKEGLTINERVEEKPHQEKIVESYTLDLEGLDPGIYTAYVTIKDMNSDQMVSRYLTFRVRED